MIPCSVTSVIYINKFFIFFYFFYNSTKLYLIVGVHNYQIFVFYDISETCKCKKSKIIIILLYNILE